MWAGPGRPPYHPRVLAALWIYGMSEGLETAAGIAKACKIRDDFRWLTGGLSPSDQTLLNFLTGSEAGLASIWAQALKSMHQAGHIDLSVIAEDGTKLRANASPRSFLTVADIGAVIEKLKMQIADKLSQIANCSENGQQDKAPSKSSREDKTQVELRNLRLRLSRAESAARELDRRVQRRDGQAAAERPEGPKFTRQDFQHEPDRNILICPARQELRFVGQYPKENGRGSFRLYGRSDCDGCPLKARCTDTRGRRVKIALHAGDDPNPADPPARTFCATGQTTTEPKAAGTAESEHPGGPRASITEPEAVMMLATSEKRWEPSYNADLAVTRHGIIVSQFLTKDTTDYHHFQPALQAVTSTVGKPESWIGDGHYGTQANILLADRAGVFLYAPPASHSSHQNGEPPPAPVAQPSGFVDQPNSDVPTPCTERFTRKDFRPDPERDVVLCPADQELRFIGVYATDNRRGAYRLYGRSGCCHCLFKNRCTDGTRRRFKIPILNEDSTDSPKRNSGSSGEAEQDLGRLLEALESRMKEVGDAVLRFRRETVEPTNAHLKQHGLGRFHVRGLARCGAILTLACIAHNFMKWKAREAARSLRNIA